MDKWLVVLSLHVVSLEQQHRQELWSISMDKWLVVLSLHVVSLEQQHRQELWSISMDKWVVVLSLHVVSLEQQHRQDSNMDKDSNLNHTSPLHSKIATSGETHWGSGLFCPSHRSY